VALAAAAAAAARAVVNITPNNKLMFVLITGFQYFNNKRR
jgi:hypothetical protein